MYSLSTIDKMEQSLYGPEISSYWRVSSPCVPVSGWLFDVAEIGKHWLSSESLGDFTSSHRRPSCTYHARFMGITLAEPIGRSARKLVHRSRQCSREDKHVCQILLLCEITQFIQLIPIHFKVQSGMQRLSVGLQCIIHHIGIYI